MTKLRRGAAVIAALALIAPTGAGCSYTAGKAVRGEPATSVTTTPRSTTSAAAPTPAGPPVGTATMKVIGGDAPVTITYRINGGAEQTEADVLLPWEKEYDVYDEVETSVTADGGGAELTCTIMMDGKLAAFKTEVRPTCSFAYYG